MLYIVFFLMIRVPTNVTRTAHAFPTRCSAELRLCRSLPLVRYGLPGRRAQRAPQHGCRVGAAAAQRSGGRVGADPRVRRPGSGRGPARPGTRGGAGRSEEHTSELQSLMRISYAVFCLKKKKKDNHIITD